MRLTLILLLLGLKLRWSAWRDDDFRKRIMRINRIIVVRTEDGRQARSYVFRNNTVRAHPGMDPQATAELVWSDAGIAVKAMLSGDQIDSFSALGRGELSILGNLQDALWFSDLAA